MTTSMARICTFTWTSPVMCERNIDLYMFDTRYDLSCLIWWTNNAKILIDCLKFVINVTAHVIGAHCRSLLRSNRVAVYPGSSHDSIRSKYSYRNRDLGDKPNWNFNANQSAGTLAEGNSRVKNRVAYERRCESKNIHKGINWKTQKMRRGKRPRSLWTAQRRLESSAHLRRAFPPFIGSPTAILPPPYH